MKLRKIFLLLMITLLFLGLSYATEASNDTTTDTSIADTNDEVVHSSNTPINEIENNIDEKTQKKYQNNIIILLKQHHQKHIQ